MAREGPLYDFSDLRKRLSADACASAEPQEERKKMNVPQPCPRRRKPLDAGVFQPGIGSFRLHLAAEGKAAKTVRTYTDAVAWFAAAHLIPRTSRTRWEQVEGHDVQRWLVHLLTRYSDAYASNQKRKVGGSTPPLTTHRSGSCQPSHLRKPQKERGPAMAMPPPLLEVSDQRTRWPAESCTAAVWREERQTMDARGISTRQTPEAARRGGIPAGDQLVPGSALAAEGKAAKTVRMYTEAVQWFATAHLIPQTSHTRREQVSGQDIQWWMVWLLARYGDSYASNQYRSAWAGESGAS